MSLDTKEEIEQYLLLENKSDSELKAICEGMELPLTGERRDLINRLMGMKIQPQLDFMYPQMIALRTKIHGTEIPGADAFMKLARKTIFDGTNNKREFSVLNEKGQPYTMVMKYAKCSEQTMALLFQKNMIYPHQAQRELVRLIQKEPSLFVLHLVQRSYGKDKTFIMLHSEPRAT